MPQSFLYQAAPDIVQANSTHQPKPATAKSNASQVAVVPSDHFQLTPLSVDFRLIQFFPSAILKENVKNRLVVTMYVHM